MKPTKRERRPAMKRRLGDLANGLYSTLLAMGARERRAAMDALAGLSGTNCGWTLYEMRFVLAEFVKQASWPHSKRWTKEKPHE